MKIKAILFDMDGVLIEAKDWHYQALNRALELFGMSISITDHLTVFDGLPTRRKLEILTSERNLPYELHDFINELKQTYTLELVWTECKPRFIHERALSNLKAKGYKMALCSNSVRKSIQMMMQKSGLEKYMDLFISNEDVRISKPDPEMYLKAMDFFGLDGSECLIIEDNENGVKAAKAAGGHLMIINNVNDTNIENITKRIEQIESDGKEVF